MKGDITKVERLEIAILLVKNIDGTDFQYVNNVSKIDSHVPELYTKNTLQEEIL